MKPIILAGLLLLFASVSYGQGIQTQQSLTMRTTVHCDGRIAGNCTYTVYPGSTGIIMAAETAAGNGTASITDSLGNSWHRDFCNVQGDCLWSFYFGSSIRNVYGVSDTLTISPNYYGSQGYSTFLFIYDHAWTFTGRGAHGSYFDVSPFAECPTASGCHYNWTGLFPAEAGELIIGWDNSRSPVSAGFIPKPSAGFYIEATDHNFAIEDMIAPIESLYAGSVTWQYPDGSDAGSGHWYMGVAVYSRTN